jgi:hypothetical protein
MTKRWIVALVAVAFLAGGPALAACKSGAKCATAGKTGCSMQAAPAAPCGQAKAGCPGAAMERCSKGASACGQGAGMSCGKGMACKPMAKCGSGCDNFTHMSHDPSSIWYRGPKPAATLLDWACCDKHHGRKPACGMRGGMPECGAPAKCGSGAPCGKQMSCGSPAACGGAMKCSSKADCGKGMSCGTPASCGQAMDCGKGGKCGDACPHARGRTAWKSGCGANCGSAK